MIYSNSFWGKELKLGYVENNISKKRQIGFGIFLGLMSFSIYFMTLTLERSVVSDNLPELMYNSYFSTLYILINVSVVFYVFYLIIYYEYLTFAEIIRNRWYTLVKMGHNPVKMIFVKIGARIVSIGLIYTLGFCTTIFLTSFLKFPFIFDYIFSLYIVGLINLIILTVVSMTLSLVVKNSILARYYILLSLIILYLVQYITGYEALISNREMMKNILSILSIKSSPFILIAIVVIGICLWLSVVRARSIAKYYNFPYYKKDLGIEDGVEIVIVDEESGEVTESSDYIERKESKALNWIVNSLFLIFIGFSIILNSLILLLSIASADSEITIFGQIPYIFESESMEPAIEYNDLAFFKNVGDSGEVKKSDIVLYKVNNILGVGKVEEVNGNKYRVDILNYPKTKDEGSLAETIKRPSIYGVYSGRSRWLGALILFANSTIGRLLFLIIPAFLIFFYKDIMRLFRNLVQGGLKE